MLSAAHVQENKYIRKFIATVSREREGGERSKYREMGVRREVVRSKGWRGRREGVRDGEGDVRE